MNVDAATRMGPVIWPIDPFSIALVIAGAGLVLFIVGLPIVVLMKRVARAAS